jgi:hypothetical protein
MSMFSPLKDESTRGILTLIGGGIAAVVAATWAIFTFVHTNSPPPEPICAYTSIRGIGWSEGHKTNFCKNAGYPAGNYNGGNEYSDGGICMRGPEPKICVASVTSTLPANVHCKPSGTITECYRK